MSSLRRKVCQLIAEAPEIGQRLSAIMMPGSRQIIRRAITNTVRRYQIRLQKGLVEEENKKEGKIHKPRRLE